MKGWATTAAGEPVEAKLGDELVEGGVEILANTELFHSIRQSRVTDPSVDVEYWSMSRVTQAFVEAPSRLEYPLPPRSAKKGKISVRLSKFWGVSRKNSAAVERSNR